MCEQNSFFKKHVFIVKSEKRRRKVKEKLEEKVSIEIEQERYFLNQNKSLRTQSSLAVQGSFLALSLLWCTFDPWSRTCGRGPKKKKKKEKENSKSENTDMDGRMMCAIFNGF